MNKKYRNLILGCILSGPAIFSLSSCADYLDTDKYFSEMLVLDSAFTKRTYAEGFLSNAYEHLYREISDIASGGQGGYLLYASDELLRTNASEVKRFQNCEYSATSNNENRWARGYEPIRKATTFIQKIDLCRDIQSSERLDLKAQGRFLRAYSYWAMMRQYGPLPMIPEDGLDISLSYDQLSLPRNTFEECVQFVTEDLVKAAQNLPQQKRSSNNIGRPTKGAALALRAKVYLYAASPLYNGNTDLFNLKDYDGNQLIDQTYDESKWARAAAAAKEVIDLDEYDLLTVAKVPGKTVEPPYHAEYSNKSFPDGWADIDPYESYRQMFNGAVTFVNNPELIFTRPNDRDGNINDLVGLAMPKSLGGDNSIAVTQKQVNAYAMSDGRSITEAKATGDYQEDGFTTNINGTTLKEEVSVQYINREPRFYASIAYNGCLWECTSTNKGEFKNQQVFYYNGKTDGKSLDDPDKYPVTGFGMKKYVNPEDSKKDGGFLQYKLEPAIRYADVLLEYAEALNELTPGKTYTFKGYNNVDVTVSRTVEELRAALKPIRMRAGLPDFTDAVYNDQKQLREAIKHERQIEMFAESVRYFDLRRWKDAPVEENMPIEGCNMEMGNNDAQRQNFYKKTVVNSYPKIFLDKMYLWPIPDYELKLNKRLTQNPGW